jgi:hypothetical protein
LLLALGLSSVACQKEKEAEKIPEPTPKVLPAKVAVASIASVQILEDCPDAAPETIEAEPPSEAKAPGPAPAKSAPARESMPASMSPPSDDAPVNGGGAAPCQQSTIQITFSGQGAQSSKVVLKELHLLTPEGQNLGAVNTRLPPIWGEPGVYSPWDAILQPGKDAKVSYKITPPNWSAAETILGTPTHGKMFVLEAVIEIDGQSQKVQSQQFARFEPHMVPT